MSGELRAEPPWLATLVGSTTAEQPFSRSSGSLASRCPHLDLGPAGLSADREPAECRAVTCRRVNSGETSATVALHPCECQPALRRVRTDHRSAPRDGPPA